MVDKMKKERGAVTIQVALFLPILFIVLIGIFEVWKILYVRQTLNDAAAQGARLVSLQSNVYDPVSQGHVQTQAQAMIRRAVTQNGLVGERALDPLQLDVIIDTTRHCEEPVTIILTLKWVSGSEFGQPSNGWLPFLRRDGNIRVTTQSMIVCEGKRDARFP